MPDVQTAASRRLDWRVCGLAVSCFLAISYILCVLWDLAFPSHAMYRLWMDLLPGFTWLTWGSFFLGLVEVLAYGIYAALVFCPLYNLFARLLETS
ncbi:hypothetical protein KQH29_00155 [bacterium]|nr:hypothetical protein [bacterium]